MNKHFTKDDIHMAGWGAGGDTIHMKTFHLIYYQRMKMKTTLRYHYVRHQYVLPVNN